MSFLKPLTNDPSLDGVGYLDFMRALSNSLAVRSYLEIGTDTGESLSCFRADAVCIDPSFAVSRNVLADRRRAFFFQMTSDEFFLNHDLRLFLPGGFDVAFLDGLHLFEALLRDFINAERYANARSVILLHDCVPTNFRMAERENRIDETEDPSTRRSWAGDVWRLLPVLHRFRPDLTVTVLDCPPTGLVACTNLNPFSHVLADNFDSICAEFLTLDLATFGLDRLWEIFPVLDSQRLYGHQDEIPAALFGQVVAPTQYHGRSGAR